MADIVQGLVDLGLGVYDRFIGDPKKEKKKQQRLEDLERQTESDYDQMLRLLEGYHQGQDRLVTPEMKEEYRTMLSEYDPNAYIYDFETMFYLGDWGRYLTIEISCVEDCPFALMGIEFGGEAMDF